MMFSLSRNVVTSASSPVTVTALRHGVRVVPHWVNSMAVDLTTTAEGAAAHHQRASA